MSTPAPLRLDVTPGQIVLASASPVRAALLSAAGVVFDIHPARIDEAALRAGLAASSAPPRDIADALADLKARKLSERFPGAVVIGCDQVLDLDGQLFSKPETPDAARAQLRALRGRRHALHSAAVLYRATEPVWRHVGEVQLTMRAFSDAFLDGYLARCWDSARHSPGAYKLEEEGIRLFSRIDGDYFSALGLPLLPLLDQLARLGAIDT